MYPSIVFCCIILMFKGRSIECRVPMSDFFQFGPSHKDEVLPKGNKYFVSSKLDLSDPPFNYYGDMQDFAEVSTWGEIYLNEGATIMAFNAEFDTSIQGNIYARKSTNAVDLGKAQHEICSAFPVYCGVELRWAVIATFYRVVPFNFTYSGSNTLQVVLTADGTKTFVVFLYNDVDWYQSYEEDKHDIWLSKAGFHMSKNRTSHSDYLPGSGTSQMRTLEDRSNCGFPGKWIFRVDSETICAPDTVCSDPNDLYDSCHTQNCCTVMKWLLIIECMVLITIAAAYLHLKRNICSFELLRGYFARAKSAILNWFHGYFRFQNDDILLV
ncbi:nidogen-like domain-containing protein [Ditylenchus destructor]|nr:nidogen-like domain-containing protein [Ditylenchus destructor]